MPTESYAGRSFLLSVLSAHLTHLIHHRGRTSPSFPAKLQPGTTTVGDDNINHMPMNPEDENWLRKYLKSLPDAFNFDFEKSSRNLIADQGLQWVKDHADLLRHQAEYIASL